MAAVSVKRVTDILEISGSCNSSRLRIHLFYGPGFWTLRVIKTFFPDFGFWAKMEGHICHNANLFQ